MKPNAYPLADVNFPSVVTSSFETPVGVLHSATMQPGHPSAIITILHRDYPLPSFILNNEWAAQHYKQWLQKRAYKYVLKDRYRFPELTETVISADKYLLRIHNAVVDSKGNDYYTNDPLDWGLILKLTNETSHKLRSSVREKFSMLPVVLHSSPDNPRSPFRICSFETFDYLKDKDVKTLLEFSSKVIRNMNRARI